MATGRTYWDNDTTKIFLDLCIAEKEKLNFNFKKGLTKAGWNNVYRNFRQQTGRAYGSKQLQNKFHSLKRLYKVWRRLKNATGARWDNTTGTIAGDEDWWQARIADNPEAQQLRNRPLANWHELTILFGSMDTEEGDMLCADDIGDRTPSGGSEGNRAPILEDNVGQSSVVRVAQRPRKEQMVDSIPPKRTKNTECHVEPISESMLESRNETSAIRQEQDEVTELLQVVEKDGVDQGSELYFIATELFRLPARRAAFRSIRAPANRIAWLRWTWDNTRKK
ncbi:hypothetical protein ACP70R_030254 [Stipagrostis hirtigluma subsp. patula]